MSDAKPPRRRFRSQWGGPTASSSPGGSGIAYAAVTERHGSDHDVLLGYQIFLGRDPENSFVIADGKSNPLRGFLHGLITSAECQSAVFTPMLAARKMPHERMSAGPTAEHTDWLLHMYDGDAAFADSLRAATSWRALWRILIGLPDFPNAQAPALAAAPADPPVIAVEADSGFVLITIEQPKADETLFPGAILTGSGWAIAPTDIAQISVHLNGVLLSHARHGLPRPDVARNFRHYRHVDHCGFAFTVTLPADIERSEPNRLRIGVTTIDGRSAEKSVIVGIGDATAPRHSDTAPIRLGIDDARIDRNGILTLRGWAVAHETLARLTVHVGDRTLGEADRGVSRPDLARTLANFPDGARAGFVFAASLAGETPGPASIRIQATDSQGRQRQAIAPIDIQPLGRRKQGTIEPGAGASQTIRLEIDKPLLDGDVAVAPVSGALTISGWVVAPEGVQSVSVFCDGADLGQAYLGMRREDIGRAFPMHAGALLAGFAMVLPPNSLAEGTRTLRLEARSRTGATLDRSFAMRVEPAFGDAGGASIRTTMPRAEIAFGLELLARRKAQPVFHVLIHSRTGDGLGETLYSLARQAYPHWAATLVVPNAKSATATSKRIQALVPELTQKLHVHIAQTSVPAPVPALICVLEEGDELGCDALLEFATAHATTPEAGFLHADELRPDAGQARDLPFFKPAWSPELLLGMNYVGRPWCATAATVAAAGLSPATLAETSPYDAVLRLTEAAGHVLHIDQLLLRRGPASAEPPESEAAALRAALTRRGMAGRVVQLGPGTWRLARNIAAPGRVSIIMPTCGARALVRTAIPSICETTRDHDVEIVILDNVPARDRKLKTWLRNNADTVIDMPGRFNWSRFNNVGAAAATGDTLIFLNDDMECRQAGWLHALLEHTQSPAVGAVGARLLYPDGKVQHAGQYLADTHARHAFRFAQGADPGPFGLTQVARETISVTGACIAVRKAVFQRLGGFEEAHSVVNNDLDFCLRARQAGLAVIYTPHATLIHHELASRADLEDAYDEARFAGAWRQHFLRGDPYHSPRLLAEADHYGPDPELLTAIHIGPSGPAVADIKTILAVKLDHIGDFLTAIPALRSLKQRFPQARLCLLAPPATASLAAHEPSIDETLEFTFFHAVSGRGQLGVTDDILEALRARLAPYRFDMAIDLRMQPETRDVLRFSGAPFLCGYDHEGRFPFLRVALEWEGDTSLLHKRQHISERLLQLVAAAGEACAPIPPPVLKPAARPIQAAWQATLPPGFLGKSLVCVHPGVGNAVRQWPAGHYAALVDLLTQDSNLHAILIGGGEEAPIAEDILRRVAAPQAVISLAGRVKLDALGELMQACVLFVGNNSGPKHLAASLGVPTLGIHSAVVDAVEWGPLGPASFAIRRDMVCSPCYLEFASDCPRAMACLTSIKPRDAYASCLRLLAMRPDAEIHDLPVAPARRPRYKAR